MQLLHLVHPKYLIPREKKCGVVYEIQLACENIRFSSLFAAGDVFAG